MRIALIILLILTAGLLVWVLIAPNSNPITLMNRDYRRDYKLEKCEEDEECSRILKKYRYCINPVDPQIYVGGKPKCDEEENYLRSYGVIE